MSDSQKDVHNSTKFWLDDVSALFVTPYMILPSSRMTRNEKLNALTRLSIVAAVVMYFFDSEYWLMFLLLAIFLIVLIKFFDKRHEGFTVTPTYNSTDFMQTTVTPLFSEEWQIPPPVYDLQDDGSPIDETFEVNVDHENYPYGQYLTKTNLLPVDEETIYKLNKTQGSTDARAFENSMFTRHTLAFREDSSRIFKKSLARRFRQNCNDTYSPYSSY